MDEAKRVLFVAPSAYPLGGVATWLDYVVPGLREKNWNVTLGLTEGRFHNVDAYVEQHPDEQTLRIHYGTGSREGRLRSLVRVFQEAAPDVVVAAHIADVERAVNRIRLQATLSPRVAVSMHALQPEFIATTVDNARLIDAVVCTNRLTCAAVKASTGIYEDRIYYAPYGVEIDTAVRRNRKPNGTLHIAYVGRLDRAQKRIQDIVEIVTELEKSRISYELSIAGSGPGQDWLRSQLYKSLVNGRLKCFGPLPSDEVKKRVYETADALLITSLWETGPIVAWEAMACGVPVVTSTYIGSGLEGSLENERNCLMFPIGDATTAVNCFKKLRDPSLRRKIICNGIDLVRERYSIETSIRYWDACLRAIVKRPPLRAAKTTRESTSPAGRLDRLFGVQLGENIRELLRLQYRHDSPGGEWPHAGAIRDDQGRICRKVDDDAFWRKLMSLDQNAVGSVLPKTLVMNEKSE